MKRIAEFLYRLNSLLQLVLAGVLLWNGWGEFAGAGKDFPLLLVLFFFALVLGQKLVPLNPGRSLWLSLSDFVFYLVLFTFPTGVVVWFTAVTYFCLYSSYIFLGTFRSRSLIFPMTAFFTVSYGAGAIVFNSIAGGNLQHALAKQNWLAIPAIFLVWIVVLGLAWLNVAITYVAGRKLDFMSFLRSIPNFLESGDLVSTLLGALLALVFRTDPFAAVLVAVPVLIFALSNEAYARTATEFSKLMEVLLKALESSDPSGYSHSQRVALYAKEIVLKIGGSAEEARDIYELGLIHDLGALAVPDAVIFKQGPLSNSDWALIQKHPLQTSSFVKHLPRFKRSVLALESHHERFDGLGYPRGLTGEKIPLEARIMAVADAYDAMTHDRPFKKRLTKDVALRRLWIGRGKQFDADAVQALLAYLEEEPPSRFLEDFPLWLVAESLAEEMGLSASRTDDIHEAAILHDLNPPSDIFLKPGESGSGWWQVDYREHIGTSEGLRQDFPTSEEALKILWNHHEWFSDLREGAPAPLEPRILAVSEAFVSCLESGMEWPLAIVRIKERVGTQFDPDVARSLETALARGKVPMHLLLGIRDVREGEEGRVER